MLNFYHQAYLATYFMGPKASNNHLGGRQKIDNGKIKGTYGKKDKHRKFADIKEKHITYTKLRANKYK